MKTLFKKIAIFILVFNLIVVPLVGCGEPDKEIEGVVFEDAVFDYDKDIEHTLLISGELPNGVSATYENNKHTYIGIYQATCTLSGVGYITKTLTATMTIKYNDNGKYDEESYAYRNSRWADDTEDFNEYELAGTFSNGQSQILYATQTTIDDNTKTKAGLSTSFNSTTDQIDAYYTTQLNLNVQEYAPSSNGYVVLENKTVNNQTAYLSITPECSKQEFLQADYLEFYAFYDLGRYSGIIDPNEMTLYASNFRIFFTDENTWVKVKIPLDVYKGAQSDEMSSYNNGQGVQSREDFYDYLCSGKTLLKTKVNLRNVSGDDTKYKIYFSDLKLKVEQPNLASPKLGNRFTRLEETEIDDGIGKETLKNIYPRYSAPLYASSSVVEYDGLDGIVKMDLKVSKNKNNKNTLLNCLYVQVNPTKTYKQIAKYDALAITMRIDTQNPNSYLAITSVPSQSGSVDKTIARFQANKWITFEIPVEDILCMYSGLENAYVYTSPSNGYIWSNDGIQPLFYLTYEVIENGNIKKASSLYSSRIDQGGISKWTDVPSNGNEYKPIMQGNWIQYPMAVYFKSLKLIKK